jgi:TctA family transporter
MGEQLRLRLQPVGALLELLIAGCLGVGLAGEALRAQVPQRLLPLPTGLFGLARQRQPRPLDARSTPDVVRSTTQRSLAGA